MRTIPTLSRRSLLAGGGAVAAGAALGAAPAWADVPNSARFDLTGAGDDPVVRKWLGHNWVMQSFAYDNVAQNMYFAEVEPGSASGDLWITRTNQYGTPSGSMKLQGFGHGVSIAVEPYNGSVYLWTEWKASSSGFGTRIGRFAFAKDTVLAQTSSTIQDRTPAIGDTMVNPQPVIDPSTSRLLVRYKTGADLPRIVAFDLADARAGRLGTADRLVERALPSRGTWGADNPFQGYTAYGRYAYLLEGRANGPSYITVIDLNATGQSTVVDRWETTAGKSLPGREPQGMAIWMHGNGPRLAFGFHSNTSGTRQANVFYKSQFV